MKAWLRQFIAIESASGWLLLAAAILALCAANSPWGDAFGAAANAARFTIDDGLMTLFFLIVGVELRHTLGSTGLSALRAPGLAALGGMAVPCLVYLTVAHNDPALWRGWAIPSATDIAFALAVAKAATRGRRDAGAIAAFLLALAVLDDLGAILVIGLFYAGPPALLPLLLAAGLLLVLGLLRRQRVQFLWPYLLTALLLWGALWQAGLHPVLAGVALAVALPAARVAAVERALHPLVAFLILPLFALANAGVPLAGVSFGPLPLAIALGLIIGKPLGIAGGVALAQRLGWPAGLSPRAVWGTGCLGGIGFTMALFIGGLAFAPALQDQVRAGVLVGSLVAALLGWLILRAAGPAHPGRAGAPG